LPNDSAPWRSCASPLQVKTNDAYFLVSWIKDADKRAVTAITDWPLGQFCRDAEAQASDVRAS
jgi:hypothetical protein